MSAHDLFMAGCYDGMQTYHITAEDRVRAVKRATDRAALEAALVIPGLQKTVERAIRARLRALK